MLSNEALLLDCNAVVKFSYTYLWSAAVNIDEALVKHADRLANNIFLF